MIFMMKLILLKNRLVTTAWNSIKANRLETNAVVALFPAYFYVIKGLILCNKESYFVLYGVGQSRLFTPSSPLRGALSARVSYALPPRAALWRK